MIEFNPEEKIILLRKRHGLPLMLDILPSVFFIFLLLASLVFLHAGTLFVFAGALVIQMIVVAIMIMLTDYFLDYWIITNERTIHAEVQGPFHQVITSIAHDKVQDITITTSGILSTFFHYGSIQVESAGAVPHLMMKEVPDPEQVKVAVQEAQRAYISSDKSTA